MQMMLGGTHNKQMHTKGTRAHLVMNARISEALLFLSDNKGGGWYAQGLLFDGDGWIGVRNCGTLHCVGVIERE